MSNLKLPPRGLTYVDANQGRIFTIEDDVLGVKKKIEQRWPELEVYWDNDQVKWIVVEHCKDGVDRLVLRTECLDDRVIDRLEKADNHVRGQEDPEALADAYNDQLDKDRERAFNDQVGDLGERLVHAFHKDGLIVSPKVSFSISNR